MMSFFIHLVVALSLVFSVSVPAFAQSESSGMERVLDVAEDFFVKLDAREYQTLWALLTEKSRKTIVKDTYKILSDNEVKPSQNEIYADFDRGGPVAESYWSGFLGVFDPQTVLSESVWSMESLKKDRAVIRLLHKKAENPALLQMSKEKGLWKVGLVETFWSRKPD